MPPEASNLSSAMPVLWRIEQQIRSKAMAKKQNPPVANVEEMTALEMKVELLVSRIQSFTQQGLSMDAITRKLEEDIYQVQLLVRAEKRTITANDVEASLSEYRDQSEWVELIESIKFACRVSLKISLEGDSFVQHHNQQLPYTAEDKRLLLAIADTMAPPRTYHVLKTGLQQKHPILNNLLQASFVLDVQLICAILVLEKERILSHQELRFLCDAINDTAQTLGATWRTVKQSLHGAEPEPINESEYLVASMIELDLELAEQGIEEYAELIAAEERA